MTLAGSRLAILLSRIFTETIWLEAFCIAISIIGVFTPRMRCDRIGLLVVVNPWINVISVVVGYRHIIVAPLPHR
jgi:hypothetical protein